MNFLTVAFSQEPLLDASLIEPAVRLLNETVGDGFGVIIPLGGLDPSEQAARRTFYERLSRAGVQTRLASLTDLPQIARSRQRTLYTIEPDLGTQRFSDADVIRVAAKLRSHAIIVTNSQCVEGADSPLLEGGSIVEHLNFAELLEIAHGSKSPISAEAAELAWISNTSLKLFDLHRYRWTTVTHDTYEKRVRAVASITTSAPLVYVNASRDEGKFDPRISHRVALATLARHGIHIENVHFNGASIAFACGRNDASTVLERLAAIDFDVETESCVCLCVIGSSLRDASGVIHTMIEAIETAGISPLHIGDSAVTISILVREIEAQRTEFALRTCFTAAESGGPFAAHFAFDATTRILRLRNRSEKLGLRQAKLLHLLMQNAGKPIAIETIAKTLFGSTDAAAIAAVRVHVHNIRKKIEEDPVEPKFILTVPNRGYTFARQWCASLEHNDAKPPESWRVS